MVAFKLKTGLPETELLQLPWHLPLDQWPDESIVSLPAGSHRHVVRFIATTDSFVALKELPHRLALREFRVLSALHEKALPSVDLIGIASEREDRGGNTLPSVLLTHHLRYSLPYSHLFAAPTFPALAEKLVDALAVLLVRLHLDGVFWGDCSLNNALFRRDAGALRAYVVDTETAELHDELSAGQRKFDLQIAVENVAGGLLDLIAAGSLDQEIDPFAAGESLADRYSTLWAELTEPEDVSSAELASIQRRLARLNDLGFDTEELELKERDGNVRFRPTIIEEGHHKRQLARLTGIDAHENQARRLLSAMRGYGEWLRDEGGTQLHEALIATRWLAERWTPTLDLVPTALRGRLEDAELYHEVLEYGWRMSEHAGKDVPLPTVAAAYIQTELEHHADERTLIDTVADTTMH
jgi:hypothetical protein